MAFCLGDSTFLDPEIHAYAFHPDGSSRNEAVFPVNVLHFRVRQGSGHAVMGTGPDILTIYMRTIPSCFLAAFLLLHDFTSLRHFDRLPRLNSTCEISNLSCSVSLFYS
jgi:hypothetical protein